MYYFLGNCSNDHFTKDIKAIASVKNPLVINEVIANEECFPHGEPYIVVINFKYLTNKTWSVTLNGIAIKDPNDVITDNGINATVRIEASLYGDPGISELEVMLYDGIKEILISNIICTRKLSDAGSVSVLTAEASGKPIPFYIKRRGKMTAGIFKIDFGDGMSSEISNSTSLDFVLWKTYNSTGTFTYRWRMYDKRRISVGTGIIVISNPVMSADHYIFTSEIERFWPNNTVTFFIASNCISDPPSHAVYKLDFGDKSLAPWVSLPSFNCSEKVNLTTHTYKEPGCYKVHFQMKNQLGFCEFYGSVNIYHAIGSVTLYFESLLQIPSLNKSANAAGDIHLQDSHPFSIQAMAKGGKCLLYEWTIVSPYWSKSTNDNSVVIQHLVDKAGVYDVEVKVSSKINAVIERRRLVLSKSLLGLTMLVTEPDEDRQISLYLLVLEPGTSSDFTWNFGDGSILTEKNKNFTNALNLPNIKNLQAPKGLDLTKYKGIYRNYRFTADGSYEILLTAKDSFRYLTARRSVFISSSVCHRPKVQILIQSGKDRLVYSIGETFNVLTDVQISCEDSNQAVFRWEFFGSSEQDSLNKRISESDRRIK